MTVIAFTQDACAGEEMSAGGWDDNGRVERAHPRYREHEDDPSLRMLIQQFVADFKAHVEQENRDRGEIQKKFDRDQLLVEKMDVRLQQLERAAVADEARAKFAQAIGNIILKGVTLIGIIIGACVALIKFENG